MNFRKLALATVAFIALGTVGAKAEVCSDGTILRHETFYEMEKKAEQCRTKHKGLAYRCMDGQNCYRMEGPLLPGVKYCTRSRPPGAGRAPGTLQQCG